MRAPDRSIMDLLELVKKRESCRNFTGEPVSDAALREIVEAGRLAPSACNSQPWKFYVVGSGGERMEKMRLASQIAGNNKFAAKASAFIVVFREKPNYSERVGQVLFGREFSAIDIGLAVENIVLAATERGIGSCILGMFTESAVAPEAPASCICTSTISGRARPAPPFSFGTNRVK